MRIRWAGHIECMGRRKVTIMKKLKWIQKIGYGNLDSDRDQWKILASTVMNLRDPYNAGRFLSTCSPGGLSEGTKLHGVRQQRHHQSKKLRSASLELWSKYQKRWAEKNRGVALTPSSPSQAAPGVSA
jgi:hypothetical protein